MADLLLCYGSYAQHPFYAREAGVHIYSAEELCYYIYNNIFILEEDFVDERLLKFIRQELELDGLAKKLERWADQADFITLCTIILQEIHYYSDNEIEHFRRVSEARRSAHPWELKRKKADYMADCGKYKAAVTLYESILANYNTSGDPSFTASLYYNEGVCYARMFRFQDAVNSFTENLKLEPMSDSIKCLFFLYLIDSDLEMDKNIFNGISGEQQYRWKEEFDKMRADGLDCAKAAEVKDAFEKDAVRRPVVIKGILNSWKQEYRNMNY